MAGTVELDDKLRLEDIDSDIKNTRDICMFGKKKNNKECRALLQKPRICMPDEIKKKKSFESSRHDEEE